jgi:hypothetical protein
MKYEDHNSVLTGPKLRDQGPDGGTCLDRLVPVQQTPDDLYVIGHDRFISAPLN